MSRKMLPSLVTAGAALALVAYGPIAQFADYHNFADQRTLVGVPRALDVLSNAGFAMVAVWGVRQVTHLRRFGYALFVVSLLLTSLGSAFYHLEPNDTRLVWDRLPIALACAGLLAGVRADTRGLRSDVGTTLALSAAAIASVLWWAVTGDLRPYLLLQTLPLALIPLWFWIYGVEGQRGIIFGAAIGLYVLAKLAELSDHAVYALTGAVSGHTLKHLLATLAGAAIVFELNGHVLFGLYRDALLLFSVERGDEVG